MIRKQTEENKQKEAKKNSKVYKILIVDSELGTRHLLTNYFNVHEENLTAVAVGSVSEAVKLLWTNRENLDIDIMLISSYLAGRISGIELVEIVRQIGFKHLPIFLLSRYEIEPDWDRAMFWGVSGCFNKMDVTSDEIAKKLKRYIREVMEYQPNVSEVIEKEVSSRSAKPKKEYTYDFLKWKSPRGKTRGVSLGASESNLETDQ